MILRCGDKFDVDGVEVEIKAIESANRAILGLIVLVRLGRRRVRQHVKLAYGIAWTT